MQKLTRSADTGAEVRHFRVATGGVESVCGMVTTLPQKARQPDRWSRWFAFRNLDNLQARQI